MPCEDCGDYQEDELSINCNMTYLYFALQMDIKPICFKDKISLNN